MSLNKLTPAQRAIWAAAKLDTENFRFNASFFLDLGDDLCWNSIDSALNRLGEEAELQRVCVQETEDDVIQSSHFPARALIFSPPLTPRPASASPRGPPAGGAVDINKRPPAAG